MIVNGKWAQNWQPVQKADSQGRFIRQQSVFRHWITADGSAGPSGQGGFQAEAGRYHLYVSYVCPWASRALMVRKLKKLESVISVSVVNPCMTDQGWSFGGYADADNDLLNGARYLHELYTACDPGYSGRATVPVLWDRQRRCIVNNESADIMRMFNTAFAGLSGATLDLYPAHLATAIDQLNEYMYTGLNNAVYQAGFATTQFAYEEAYKKVFTILDQLEARLADGRSYLFGEKITETDIRLFVTLVRFDAVYHGLFKCNRNRIADMQHLDSYTRRLLAMEEIRTTVNMKHIKAGYYSIKALNPSGIVPLGPDLNLQIS